jgi:hypothetical protein
MSLLTDSDAHCKFLLSLDEWPKLFTIKYWQSLPSFKEVKQLIDSIKFRWEMCDIVLKCHKAEMHEGWPLSLVLEYYQTNRRTIQFRSDRESIIKYMMGTKHPLWVDDIYMGSIMEALYREKIFTHYSEARKDLRKGLLNSAHFASFLQTACASYVDGWFMILCLIELLNDRGLSAIVTMHQLKCIHIVINRFGYPASRSWQIRLSDRTMGSTIWKELLSLNIFKLESRRFLIQLQTGWRGQTKYVLRYLVRNQSFVDTIFEPSLLEEEAAEDFEAFESSEEEEEEEEDEEDFNDY